jgi:type I restriction enzyme R subunit
MSKEQQLPNMEGLAEEELEVYTLLVRGKKLTQVEEQKIKLAAKKSVKKN